MSRKCHIVVLCVLTLCMLVACQLTGEDGWDTLAEGLEFGSFVVRTAGSSTSASAPTTGRARIIVMRINPEKWRMELRSRSEQGGANDKNAREWCQREDSLVAATNAGMFNTDNSAHVGYMKSGERLNNPHILRKKYLSAALFGSLVDDIPEFQLADLDEVELDSLRAMYRFVIQNLRLIKFPGENRWQERERRWSEAALAEDSAGNALFIFCRQPFNMFEFNEIILSLPLQIVRAQHLEGGPQAQMFFQIGSRQGEFVGSYETGFSDYSNESPGPIPNVIVVKKR